MADLDRLLGESDYVLIAVPLADETRGLINAARLAAMKPAAVSSMLAAATSLTRARCIARWRTVASAAP